MSPQIIPIRLPLLLKMSHVNCYLVKTDSGFFLIDTGMTNARRQLEAELLRLGCQPGNLKMIVLTHGDFDHTGNAAYIRKTFGSKIAMHEADAGMLENGDMFWNRKVQNPVLKKLFPLIVRFGKEELCTPDIFLQEGDALDEYGLNARVLNTPGHSSGSVCILMEAGELLCGDLFTSSGDKPRLNPMMYDQEAGNHSFARLKDLPIQSVYPGHGKPFAWQSLFNT